MQNRNKLVDLFIGNITNYIVHKILEMAIDNLEIINKYKKGSHNHFSNKMETYNKLYKI